MKIAISQQNKRIKIIFQQSGIVDNYYIDKAEDFLLVIDKLLKKDHTLMVNDFKNVKFKFHNIGLLTERIIRAIIAGISFDT